jgi:DNA-binding MarR family transcriptional regulator/N-acetylglutamate synthase-like GNAT family acetyltransferase
MKKDKIEKLRASSRKLVRELGVLQPDTSNPHSTPGHWHSLVEIEKDPGITISKLGSLLLMSISKISRIVNSLVKDGLVELKPGMDRREKSLYLTEAGIDAVKKIDVFSENKIKGAFEFLNESEMSKIAEAIEAYARALEKSRLMVEQVKILTLSTSRTIRKQIVNMVADIQKNEFSIPITNEINACIMRAEEEFYYNNSYNFWYAVDDAGAIIGSIGLKHLDSKNAEMKKFFVVKKYRGKGVAQKLLQTLAKAAKKHGFKRILLGSEGTLKAAHRFYEKYGFTEIERSELPETFQICELDSVFCRCELNELIDTLKK